MAKWTIGDARELYSVNRWGRDLFDVNREGHVLVTPRGAAGDAIDLHALVEELTERGVDPPILIRFTDILRTRIEHMVNAFRDASYEYEFAGEYRGVYPIKVNQQRHLVEDLVRFSAPYHLGLEAGSKPELLVCMSLLDDPEALIICNGYKDQEYIDTALLARKIGRNTVLVIEKTAEIEQIIQASLRLGVRPRLGVRAKLSRPGKGRWASSSGDGAKFGLTAAQLVELVERLRTVEMLDCLHLLHFHIGSQVTAIRTLKNALKEAARTYTELVRLGAPMGLFDVGGGLGVDYDGSRTNFDSSMNYSEGEYAADVVYAIGSACDEAGVPHPNIVTESGRATVAHTSVLVFPVLGVESRPSSGPALAVREEDHRVVQELRDIFDDVSAKTYLEAWHDALQLREEGMAAYTLGVIGLEDRARMETLFWQVCGRIRSVARKQTYVPEDLETLPRLLADVYYCNFSVFQSIPDAWAIDHLFPVLPIHRLDEKPERRGILADLTCDSDGVLDKFIDLRDVKTVLELHALGDDPYYLGVFLVGAYQEILGDLHNLFGDTHAVHVSVDAKGYHIDHVLEGDTVSDVLGYVQYDRRQVLAKLRAASERALKEERLTRAEFKRLIGALQSGLDGYTYLEAPSEG